MQCFLSVNCGAYYDVDSISVSSETLIAACPSTCHEHAFGLLLQYYSLIHLRIAGLCDVCYCFRVDIDGNGQITGDELSKALSNGEYDVIVNVPASVRV